MSDIKLEKSLQNLHRVAGLVSGLRLEGCGGLYCPAKETVAVTIKAQDIPPMEVIIGWLYPPRFTFVEDGPEFELVDYLADFGPYTLIQEPYDKIINEITKIWLEQVALVGLECSDDPKLKEVIERYNKYKEWYAKRILRPTGYRVVDSTAADADGAGAQHLSDGKDDKPQAERPDFEMTEDERWKRFEELEKRVKALEQFRKVGF